MDWGTSISTQAVLIVLGITKWIFLDRFLSKCIMGRRGVGLIFSHRSRHFPPQGTGLDFVINSVLAAQETPVQRGVCKQKLHTVSTDWKLINSGRNFPGTTYPGFFLFASDPVSAIHMWDTAPNSLDSSPGFSVLLRDWTTSILLSNRSFLLVFLPHCICSV